MGCKLCPSRDNIVEYEGGDKGTVTIQAHGKERQVKNDRMREIRELSFGLDDPESAKTVLYVEGLECVCPTDPTGDNILLFFIAGVSLCAISGGLFGTFVPRSMGFDEWEPFCTASAATILTVIFTSACDSNGLLELEKEDLAPTANVFGTLFKGVMTNKQFNTYVTQGQLVVEDWDGDESDDVILKINEEVVVGAGTNLCRQTVLKSGDFVVIDKKFFPVNNGFRFELEEWDFSSDNNKLVPQPAGFYNVSELEETYDFTRKSKNPGIYFVSSANKSIYVLYGRLQIVK